MYKFQAACELDSRCEFYYYDAEDEICLIYTDYLEIVNCQEYSGANEPSYDSCLSTTTVTSTTSATTSTPLTTTSKILIATGYPYE